MESTASAAASPGAAATQGPGSRGGKRRRVASSSISPSHPYKRPSKKAAYVPRFHPTSAPSLFSSNVQPSSAPAGGPRVLLRDHCSSEEQRRLRASIVASNPHIAQAFFASDALPEESFPFTRLLSPSFPVLPYRERRRELKTVVPWGQRRLFLAELDFLALYAADYVASVPSHPPTVVYAGAAPGGHLSYLTRLFPALTFVLYDTAPFRLQASANVQLRCEAFSDSAALEWSSARCLFVCDVRSADLFHCSVAQVDAAIGEDLAAQMRWVEAMNPHRALLKFRLPWDEGRTAYLAGDLRLPVWGSQTTTECRLVPSVPLAYTTYSHATYEQQMFHFNTRHRVQIYEQHSDAADDAPTLTEQLRRAVAGEWKEKRRRHRDPALSGLDCCYDCTAELFILRQFLVSRPDEQQRLRRAVAQQRVEAATPSAAATPLTSSDRQKPHVPPPSAVASSVITSVSPASALSATVAHQRAVIDELAVRLQRAGAEDAMEEEAEAAAHSEAPAAVVEGSDGGQEVAADADGGGEFCDCLDCLCVVLSSELSSELREGRTLLTAPLQPAGVGTANARAHKTERRQRKSRRQQQRKASEGTQPRTARPRKQPPHHTAAQQRHHHYDVEHQPSDD